MPRFAANLSMMYTSIRSSTASPRPRRDGFEARRVPVPLRARAGRDPAARLEQHGLQQVLFNAPPGDCEQRRARHRGAARAARTSSAAASTARSSTRTPSAARACT